jgi:hypothetical protein
VFLQPESTHFLSTNQSSMDFEAFQNRATQYYLFENMPDNVIDNWYRYIVTDGVNCREVEHDYLPQENEMVFFCSIKSGHVQVELHKNGAEAPQ